jgi:hypothetical protein
MPDRRRSDFDAADPNLDKVRLRGCLSGTHGVALRRDGLAQQWRGGVLPVRGGGHRPGRWRDRKLSVRARLRIKHCQEGNLLCTFLRPAGFR